LVPIVLILNRKWFDQYIYYTVHTYTIVTLHNYIPIFISPIVLTITIPMQLHFFEREKSGQWKKIISISFQKEIKCIKYNKLGKPKAQFARVSKP